MSQEGEHSESEPQAAITLEAPASDSHDSSKPIALLPPTGFVRACQSLRDQHWGAFILGFPTIGVTYAMAGIGGSLPTDHRPPLVSSWTKGRVKWFAFVSVLAWLGALLLYGYNMILHPGWNWILLPGILLLAYSAIEVLYELLKGTDGFAIASYHVLRSERARADGPARAVESLIDSTHPAAGQTLALFWCWLVGFTYLMGFVTAIGLAFVAFTIFLLLLGLFVALWIINLFMGGGEARSESHEEPDEYYIVLPIPRAGLRLTLQGDSYSLTRERDDIMFKRKRVGFVKKTPHGEEFYAFSRKGRCDLFYLLDRDLAFYDSDRRLRGKVVENQLFNEEGDLIATLEQIS